MIEVKLYKHMNCSIQDYMDAYGNYTKLQVTYCPQCGSIRFGSGITVDGDEPEVELLQDTEFCSRCIEVESRSPEVAGWVRNMILHALNETKTINLI